MEIVEIMSGTKLAVLQDRFQKKKSPEGKYDPKTSGIQSYRYQS